MSLEDFTAEALEELLTQEPETAETIAAEINSLKQQVARTTDREKKTQLRKAIDDAYLRLDSILEV